VIIADLPAEIISLAFFVDQSQVEINPVIVHVRCAFDHHIGGMTPRSTSANTEGIVTKRRRVVKKSLAINSGRLGGTYLAISFGFKV
jgi:hypothetical protein